MKTLEQLKNEVTGYVAEYKERQRVHAEAIFAAENAIADATARKEKAIADGDHKAYTDAVHDLEWNTRQKERLSAEKMKPYFTVEEYNAFNALLTEACNTEKKDLLRQLVKLFNQYDEVCDQIDEKYLLASSIGRDMRMLYVERERGMQNEYNAGTSRPFRLPKDIKEIQFYQYGL